MKLSSILSEVNKLLRNTNIQEPLKESKLLICHVLCARLEIFLLDLDRIITPMQKKKIFEIAYRRKNGEPFAYLTNSVSFFKDIFYINKHVLIPRPETEILVEVVLKNITNKNISLNILDICLGSGVILGSLLKQLPNSFGIGTDISLNALKVANKNFKKLKLNHRSRLINTHWSEGIKNNYFNIITCNPPYIDDRYIKNLPKEVKNYEPLIALKGGINGLDSIKNLLPSARRVITTNGLLVLEIGYDQSQKIGNILNNNKFTLKEMIKDLSGNYRVVIAKPI
jgi:release factor glutamine methyltransferase